MSIGAKILKKTKTAGKILKEEGLIVCGYKAKEKIKNFRPSLSDYEKWIRDNEKNLSATKPQAYQPFISVVIPVYNVTETLLRACIDSVLGQSYSNYELCLADDASTMPEVRQVLSSYEGHPKIKMTYREENGHISRCTNTAIALAEGEFIAFMDCDDILAVNALYEVVCKLNENRSYDFIYSDEDKIDEAGTNRHQPHFKPDWSPDTMMSLMYTCHLGVYRKSIGEEIGWLREGFEGAQDYDFTLRFTEKTSRIAHIPKILYHWRERAESTAVNPMAKEYIVEAARRTKEEALERRGLNGSVEWVEGIYQFRVNYCPGKNTKVSIIIPSKDNFEVYRRCIETLTERTEWKNYEIITVDNGSSPENKEKYQKYCEQRQVTYLYQPMEFNFSRMCNIGAEAAAGNLLLFLNDDMEIIRGEWLERMAGQAELDHTGAVGAKLLYPDTTLIQHIGVFSFTGGPVHSFCQMDDTPIYYFCRNKIEYNYCAVTGACLMVSKDKFNQVGGFNEDFAVAYNDIDLCFKLIQEGYYNVARMDAVLYHHESLSRGNDVKDPAKFERLKMERRKLYKTHPAFLSGDPWYSPNLTMRGADCSVNLDYKMEYSRRIPVKKNLQLSGEKAAQIHFDFDYVLETQILFLSGWMLVEGSYVTNARNTKVYLHNEDHVYAYQSRSVYRDDINTLSGCSGKYNLCAFETTIDRNGIQKGTYEILLEKQGRLAPTGKYITI